MQRWSGSRQHVVAQHRGREKAWLAQGGIREHKAFSSHNMRGPPGTGRFDGCRAARPRRREGGKGEGLSLDITAMFCLKSTYVFRLSFSTK